MTVTVAALDIHCGFCNEVNTISTKLNSWSCKQCRYTHDVVDGISTLRKPLTAEQVRGLLAEGRANVARQDDHRADVAKNERVEHPAHYGGKDNAYEAIKVIEAWDLGFCLGNTVKYISRAGKKDGASMLEDLKKARWYLDRFITFLERG